MRNRLSLHSHKTAYLRSTHAVLHFLLRCDKDSYDSSDCRTPYDTFYIDHRNKNNNFSFLIFHVGVQKCFTSKTFFWGVFNCILVSQDYHFTRFIAQFDMNKIYNCLSHENRHWFFQLQLTKIRALSNNNNTSSSKQ